jgi:hypothetical protein
MSRKNKRQITRQSMTAGNRAAEFNPDYSIIKRDLKRIGLLAGSFFVILIVLAIFQNQLIALLGR